MYIKYLFIIINLKKIFISWYNPFNINSVSRFPLISGTFPLFSGLPGGPLTCTPRFSPSMPGSPPEHVPLPCTTDNFWPTMNLLTFVVSRNSSKMPIKFCLCIYLLFSVICSAKYFGPLRQLYYPYNKMLARVYSSKRFTEEKKINFSISANATPRLTKLLYLYL